MVALLPTPVSQFCDANGKPYAGGSILTYLPGTTTPVTTWSESTGTSANANPIPLDSAGRCTIYASGIVRMILHDSTGALVFDQPSNTLVSTAMAPVMLAADIPTALSLLGVTTAIAAGTTASAVLTAAETTRAEAAEAALSATAAGNVTSLNASLAAETSRAEAAEAALAASITGSGIRSGSALTSGGGTVTVTFGTPFATACTAVAFAVVSGSVGCWVQLTGAPSTTGFSAASMSPLFGGSWAGGPVTFYWIATGS